MAFRRNIPEEQIRRTGWGYREIPTSNDLKIAVEVEPVLDTQVYSLRAEADLLQDALYFRLGRMEDLAQDKLKGTNHATDNLVPFDQVNLVAVRHLSRVIDEFRLAIDKFEKDNQQTPEIDELKRLYATTQELRNKIWTPTQGRQPIYFRKAVRNSTKQKQARLLEYIAARYNENGFEPVQMSELKTHFGKSDSTIRTLLSEPIVLGEITHASDGRGYLPNTFRMDNAS